MSSSKLKPVTDLVRGKDLNEALTILKFTPGKGSELIEKVVQSAAANAENNHEMNLDDLGIDTGLDGNAGNRRHGAERFDAHRHLFLRCLRGFHQAECIHNP